jgi:nitrogen fixation NifU-like protein
MSIYQELILDHYRNPRNRGVLKDSTHEASANNPTCGDKLSMQILEKNGIIESVKFTGSGCAISQASASILTESLVGKSIEEAKNLKKEDLLELLGIELSLTRLKCALLALDTLKKALR